MPTVPLRVEPDVDLSTGFEAIRTELKIPDAFAADVAAEAEHAASQGPSIPAVDDLRDIPFVTIDPVGSRDLDQAVAIEPSSANGYLVRYAIADVAAFVAPEGAVDTEARARGVTVYLPDRRALLHPPSLSEGAASLLANEERQALVWDLSLDAHGELIDARVRRARVKSRRAYAYAEVQAALDAGTADEPLQLLREVGKLREARERDRGGVSLGVPEQVVVSACGRYELAYRAPLPVEGWNSQISLLTGIAAAKLMLDAGVGVLRTLPAPPGDTVDALHRRADALGVPWPTQGGYQEFIRSLDARVPDHAALLVQAARLFRGAGYAAFDGTPPAEPEHAAVAAPYAHVTAPLRRLVDRFGNEIVVSHCAGVAPPAWARAGLPSLPELMADARHREGAADGMALDLVEATVLAGRVGQILRGVVVDTGRTRSRLQIAHPAVVASVEHEFPLGEEIRVRVAGADPVARRVDLQPV